MSNINRPPTPPHPGPDDEINDSTSQVNLQNIKVPIDLQRANDLLDLDNDSSDSEVDDNKMNDTNDRDAESTRMKYENSNTDFDDSESLLSLNSNSSVTEVANNNINSSLYPPPGDNIRRINSIDFEEIDRRLYSQPINPFNSGRNTKIDNHLKIIDTEKYKKLSSTQQFKLVTYLDSSLLNIQKKFIKLISGETDYPFNNLVNDLNEIVLLIWYSIFQVNSIPPIYHQTNVDNDNNNNSSSNDDPLLSGSTIELPNLKENFQNIGQVEYLVKIMGDFNDYLSKYKLTKFNELNKLIEFLNQLDNFIVTLIDYDNDSKGNRSFKLIHNTALIRIESIINQTKLASLSIFDSFKLLKVKEIIDSDDQTNSKEIRNSLNQLEIEIGQIYEGVLEKTSI